MMDEPAPARPTFGSVVVTLLILLAAGLLVVVFALPNSSPWLWPTIGVLAVVAGLALVIPLKGK